MPGIDKAFHDIGYLDRLAAQDTVIHRLDPRAKVLATLVFIVCVVSLGRYEVSRLLPFFLYPVVLVTLGRLPVIFLLKKIILVSPFAVLVGIFNPVFDREILLFLGPVAVSGGWVSFVSILLRFFLTVGTAMALVAVTGFPSVCLALEKLKVPRVFTVQLLFLYRYLFVLMEEGGRIARARALRSFGSRGREPKVFFQMTGNLLLRTLERAQRIHVAMFCRGFTGEIRTMKSLRINRAEVVFVLLACAGFVLVRQYNLAHILGRLFMGLLR